MTKCYNFIKLTLCLCKTYYSALVKTTVLNVQMLSGWRIMLLLINNHFVHVYLQAVYEQTWRIQPTSRLCCIKNLSVICVEFRDIVLSSFLESKL